MNHMPDRRRSARLKREAEAKKPRWHKPSWVAWLCVIVAVVVLLGLAFWQLQRLQWKEGLIADLRSHRMARAAHVLPPRGAVDARAMRFQRVALSGTYLHYSELHLAARYYNSQLGYHILTPFQLQDGRVVLVNRGWVPTEMKEQETREAGLMDGTQHIVAMVRTDDDRNAFTPDHDIASNIWFWRDVEAMAAATEMPLYPVTVDLLYDTPPGGYPIPSDGLITLRNDHLGYALTWFLLAVSVGVIFVLYHYHPPRENGDEHAASRHHAKNPQEAS